MAGSPGAGTGAAEAIQGAPSEEETEASLSSLGRHSNNNCS